MTNLLYRAFVELTGYQPAWGMLTGIHPVKLLRHIAGNWGKNVVQRSFVRAAMSARGETELALRTLRAQSAAVEALEENDFNLYVSIPLLSHPLCVLFLCVTKCGTGEKS